MVNGAPYREGYPMLHPLLPSVHYPLGYHFTPYSPQYTIH